MAQHFSALAPLFDYKGRVAEDSVFAQFIPTSAFGETWLYKFGDGRRREEGGWKEGGSETVLSEGRLGTVYRKDAQARKLVFEVQGSRV